MPIYEYRCAGCGFQDEFLQKVSEAPLRTCPSCGKPKLEKLLSAAGFQLKGSGWYATDFKAGAKPAPAPGDAKAQGKPQAGGDAKAEPKTETKSETKTSPEPAKAEKAPASAN